MARFIFLFFLLVLGICWFGTLYESSHRRTRIDVSGDTLFLGLSFLLGSCGIILAILLPRGRTRLASDYVTFARVLDEEGPLSEDELAKIAGSKEEVDFSTEERASRRYLNGAQHRSLEQLVYEGKLQVKDGRYALSDGR